MHFLAFRFKRAQLRTLALTRPLAAAFGLTPARFDMLYWLGDKSSNPTTQSRLRRALGVSAATVSRMLARLLALGLVARERSKIDRRTYALQLTEEGARRMRRAQSEIMGLDLVGHAYGTALHLTGSASFWRIYGLYSTIWGITSGLGDTAWHDYPFIGPP